MATSLLTAETTWQQPVALGGLARRALAEVLFWLVVLQLISGIFLQSQLAVFGGRVVVPGGVPKLLLAVLIVFCAAATLLVRQGRINWSHCILPATLFGCYLAADFSWLAEASGLPLPQVAMGFNKYFLYFAVIPLAVLLRPGLDDRRMGTRLLWMLVPLAGLGLAQFLLNDPILPIASEDGKFEIPAPDFFGQIRAFSLFRGVLDCGQGMAFFGGLLLARLLAHPRRAIWNFLLLLATAACVVVTFRRGAYLEFGATAVAAVAISRRWSLAGWLPWIFGGAAVALAIVGTMISATNSQGVFSSETLSERHEAWNIALEMWLHREDASLWFGTGLAQVDSPDIEPFLVDNGFLSVAAELGLVGLALWCWLMHALWRDVLAMAWSTRGSLAIGAAALLSTWMMRNVFDPMFSLYPLYVFLVFWSQPAIRPTQATTSERQLSPCS